MFISNCVDAFSLYYIVADTKYIHIYTYYLLVKKLIVGKEINWSSLTDQTKLQITNVQFIFSSFHS